MSTLSPRAEALLDAIVNGTEGSLRQRINALRDYIAQLEQGTRPKPFSLPAVDVSAFVLRPTIPERANRAGYLPHAAQGLKDAVRSPTREALDRAGGANAVAVLIGASSNMARHWMVGEISPQWAPRLATILGREWFDMWQDAAESVVYWYHEAPPFSTTGTTTPDVTVDA